MVIYFVKWLSPPVPCFLPSLCLLWINVTAVIRYCLYSPYCNPRTWHPCTVFVTWKREHKKTKSELNLFKSSLLLTCSHVFLNIRAHLKTGTAMSHGYLTFYSSLLCHSFFFTWQPPMCFALLTVHLSLCDTVHLFPLEPQMHHSSF